MQSGSGKGKLTRILSGCMCALLMWMATPALATPTAAPLTTQSTSLSGTVRVYLSSLSGKTSLSLTVDGVYSINGDSSRVLTRGGTVKVTYESGQLYLTVSGSKQSMGSQFFLRRHSGSGINGIRISEATSPGNWYNGDLEFAVRNGRMYPIVHVYMENYIHGVLPYEMGSTFPMEALKAQAVAARTYVVQAMNKRAAYYDVVDTTTDQVYRGVTGSNDRYVQAASETAGIVAMYNGSYVGGYYTASNGGQTEAVKNAWGNSSYPYLGVQDDPYDLANTASTVKSFVIYGSGSGLGSLESSLKSKVASKLSALGISTSSSAVSIGAITNVEAHTPMYAAPSRLYTKVDMTVSAWGSSSRSGSSTSVTVTFDYFSELESLLGLSINGTKNELVSVQASGNNFLLLSRRYGHGIGMSQRGAQQMANTGLSYQQIIGFYYPGCNLVQYSFSNEQRGGVDEGSVPTVTQQPQMPVEEGQGVATVTLSSPSSWLNLRESASTGAPVLAQIMHGEQVTVRTSDGVWCQVTYGSLTGYVMRDYLTFQSSGDGTATPAPSDGSDGATDGATEPTPAPGVNGVLYLAMVTLQDYNGKLNMRSAPSTSAGILARLSSGTVLEVLGTEGQWLRVRYGYTEGYVMASYTVSAGNPSPTATPAPTTSGAPTSAPTGEPGGGWGTVAVTGGTTLNLRLEPNTLSTVICRMPDGAQIQWQPLDATWAQVTYNGYTGYAMRVYLSLQSDSSQSTPTPAPTASGDPTPVPSAAPSAQTAIVSLSSASARLNMRASASGSGQVLGTIPNGAIVEIVNYGGSWCEARYYALQGYLSTPYLLFVNTSVTPAPSSAPSSAPTVAPTQNSTALTDLIVTATSLNLRASPSTGGRKLAEIPYATRLTQLEQLVGWYRVQWLMLDGYVSAAYVRSADAAITTPVTQPPAATATPAPSGDTSQADPTPAPTAAPTATPKPSQSSGVRPAENQGVVTPLNGSASAAVYNSYKDRSPVMHIAAGEVLKVVGYAGDNGDAAEWCEVLYYDLHCFVRTEDLVLEHEIVL